MSVLEPPEHFVDRIIREAIERGEFDHLPGAGKPIPGEGEVDGEGWWVRRWLKRNRLREEADRPEVPD